MTPNNGSLTGPAAGGLGNQVDHPPVAIRRTLEARARDGNGAELRARAYSFQASVPAPPRAMSKPRIAISRMQRSRVPIDQAPSSRRRGRRLGKGA